MKIRTITIGFPYNQSMDKEKFFKIGDTLNHLKNDIIHMGYPVQTIRMSTQPWFDYAKTKKTLMSCIHTLHQWSKDHHIDYFNIGPTSKKNHISWIPEILHSCPSVFCTTHLCNKQEIFTDSIIETAKVIKQNALIEDKGFGNLRFAALCNVPPNTPFYPASYHGHQTPSFSIGLENSDLVYQAFRASSSFEEAKKQLEEKFLMTYEPLSKFLETLSQKYHIFYDGIDVSVSTSIKKNESIVYAFEHLLEPYQFGQPGTLSIAKLITDTLQKLPIKKTGYCGLMLPVLEDHGLAKRNMEHCFTITNLLLYSAVCGTGLDTIPLPGSIKQKDIEHILYDVASLSVKLQKPLSARLMPIPKKNQGDKTDYSFSYFKNTTVMNPR